MWSVLLVFAATYILIAARRLTPRLFRDIEWGTAGVYAATVQRLASSGYRWRALRALADVDTPEDARRLRWLRPT